LDVFEADSLLFPAVSIVNWRRSVPGVVSNAVRRPAGVRVEPYFLASRSAARSRQRFRLYPGWTIR
jgi:hypothetical protein